LFCTMGVLLVIIQREGTVPPAVCCLPRSRSAKLICL